jgi:phage-related protein
MKSFFINPQIKKSVYSLNKSTVSKIVKSIDLLEIYGKNLGMPYSKKISQNLYELRIRGQQETRLFYCFYQNKIIFVHYIIKKSRKTPLKDIRTSLERIRLLTNI